MSTTVCDDCGDEYQRVRQHWAMSGCTPNDGESATVKLTCAECGDTFTEYRYRVESDRQRDGTKYCSRVCKHAASREGEVVDCDWCGESVYKSPSHLENDARHFCSQDCENEWRSDFMSDEGSPWWNGGPETVTCEHCGEQFTVTPAISESRRFCSRDCQTASGYETRECAVCGSPVERISSAFKGEHTVCSTSCFSDFMSEHRRGANNPAWKGGKSAVERVRSELGQKSWGRIAAEQREQANHECEECGHSPDDRSLSVHHIIPLASGGTHGDWNLMVLCNECHRRVENKTRQLTDPHLFAPLTE